MNRRNYWAFALTALGLGIGGYVWTQSLTARTAASLPDELTAAKKIGLPTTADELRAQIRKRRGTNAALDYLAAFSRAKSLKATPRIDLDLLLSGKATRKDIADAKAQIARAASPLAGLEVGSQKDLLDYNRPWERAFMLIYPDLSDTRRLTDLLCAQALLDPSKAASLATVARVGEQVGSEPTTIALFFQTWVENSAIDTCLLLLARDPQNAQLRRDARSFLAALGPFPNVRDHIAGEIVTFRLGAQQLTPKMVEEFKMSGVDIQHSGPSVALFRFPVVRRSYEATFVRFWREMAEAIPEDPEDIQSLRTAMQDVDGRFSDGNRGDHTLLRALGQFRGNLPNALGETLARRRVLAGTLDALDFQAKTGALPKSLKIPDPFGTSLVYRPQGNAFQLYSRGHDAHDGGGQAKVANAVRYDIGFGLTSK